MFNSPKSFNSWLILFRNTKYHHEKCHGTENTQTDFSCFTTYVKRWYSKGNASQHSDSITNYIWHDIYHLHSGMRRIQVVVSRSGKERKSESNEDHRAYLLIQIHIGWAGSGKQWKWHTHVTSVKHARMAMSATCMSLLLTGTSLCHFASPFRCHFRWFVILEKWP